MSSAHARSDTRIFIKQCRSLASHGHEVSFVVADGKGDEARDGVSIVDAGPSRSRLDRVLSATSRVFGKAVSLDADVYHLHDPELMPAGLKLKRLGKRVIFDSHEDVPKQILGKPYLGTRSLRLLSSFVGRYERYACSRFDGVIAATPTIRDKFLSINPCTVDINNFPVPGELDAGARRKEKRIEVCYVGDISAIRGIRELVSAMEMVRSPARLNLAGRFAERDVEAEVRNYAGWKKVNALGFQDRNGVRNVLADSMAGLVILHPKPNYLDALPVKMFEYMAGGLPVIVSDFPVWREIVEGNQCGLCVDPFDIKAIAAAIDRLVTDRDFASRMGENGRRAVHSRFNWGVEETKLHRFYAELA